MEEIKIKVRWRKYKSPVISEVFTRAPGSQSCLPPSATPFHPGDEHPLGHRRERGDKSKGEEKSSTGPCLETDTKMWNPGLEKENGKTQPLSIRDEGNSP